MARRHLMVVLAIAATIVQLSGSSINGVELVGPHVCTTVQVLTEKTTVVEYEIDTKKTSYFCLRNWNFKCYYVSDRAIPVNKERLLEESQKLRKCCDGYEPTPDGKRCRAVCSFPCIWGECVSPEVCKCHSYYEGKYCNISKLKQCPPGKYGIDCSENCHCQNGVCDPLEGNCFCAPGFIGRSCNILCPPDLYGQKCQNKCNCQNNEMCDPINGSCLVMTRNRFHEVRTVKPYCLAGFYGINCEKVCACENGGVCDPESGTCFCQPGFTGVNCELYCPTGYYGYKCQNTCKCQNNAACDPVNGMCFCQPGFFGQYCSYPCPTGFYGYHCFYKCNCKDGTVCNSVNGSCECPEGVDNVKNCTQNVVINNSTTYLENPAKNCNCNWYKAYSCDPSTGKCKCKHTIGDECYCKPGYTGYDCKTACPRNTYGINCKYTCRCRNGAYCRQSDGVCLCKRGFYGTLCMRACPHNYYGDMCLNKCNCNKTIEICDPIHGCIFNANITRITGLQLKTNNEQKIWIFKISFILDVLTLSIVIILLLFLGLPSYYFYLNRHSMQVLVEEPEDQAKKYGFYQSRDPIVLGAGRNADIAVISDQTSGVRPWDPKQPFAKDLIHAEYGHRERFDSYGTGGENLYLEIDESVVERAAEESYDHLDFLRPTGSWKPHYQCTLLQKNSTSSSCNNRSKNTEKNK
ncbi:protein draper-like isoform X2 [Sipha flava]|uniref:Protein draper-like isoform X2 n=1 Tax=Sipha flava TaxID=143950 RepID=A0A8B8FDX4_9HEMI|nr:protein draper-like isoform X2 [Sipha flava]